ncbi:M1 family aminopeptidase [Micromonospora thermarum]
MIVHRSPPGKPGVKNLFSESVYERGAMTVHALRVSVGDKAFFEILKTWVQEQRNATGTTEEFVELSERISGKQLDKLFDAWLYGTKKPTAPKPL